MSNYYIYFRSKEKVSEKKQGLFFWKKNNEKPLLRMTIIAAPNKALAKKMAELEIGEGFKIKSIEFSV